MTPSPDLNRKDRYSWLWLLVAIALGLVSSGHWSIGITAWFVSVFAIRFIRTTKGFLPFLAFVTATFIGIHITHKGIVPIPGIGFHFFAVFIAIIGFMQFWIDKKLTARLPGFINTLIFPCLMTGFEYVSAMTSEFGTWGSLAYTQYNHQIIMQLASITGLWGIIFIMNWFASIINWLWEKDWNPSAMRKAAAIYVPVLLLVCMYGAWRIEWQVPQGETVRIASLTSNRELSEIPFPLISKLFDDELFNAEEHQTLIQQLDDINTNLLNRTRREALAGAKIIYWAEGNAMTLPDGQAPLLQRGAQLARSEGIYLGMSLFVFPEAAGEPGKNIVALANPAGEILWQYHKSRPTPGEPLEAGDGIIPYTDTPYGRIGNVICFDTDFPELMRQAGEQKIDILFAPSNDWPEVADLHMQQAVFRAVENGFHLVRPTRQGVTAATDYLGNILGYANYYQTSDVAVVAHVPVKGTSTIYPVIGDLFAWIALAGFFLLTVYALLAPRLAVRRLRATSEGKPVTA